MYIIATHEGLCGYQKEPLYLGWQETARDGYFWTREDTITEMIAENLHKVGEPFLFDSYDRAKQIAKEIDIQGKWYVGEWLLDSEKITFENCKYNFDLRQYLTQNKDCYAISLTKYKKPMYQKGHFYWSSYWSKAYEVISVSKEKIKNDKGYTFTRLVNVTVRWLEDGKVATHCTDLSQRDYELRFTTNDRESYHTECGSKFLENHNLCKQCDNDIFGDFNPLDL